jgi:hypothetical protein
MFAQQRLRSGMHGSGVQRCRHMPNSASQQRRTRPAVEDAVTVVPADCRKPRIPAIWRGNSAQHDHRTRLHVKVKRIADFLRRIAVRQLELRYLSFGVHPGVGAASYGAAQGHIIVQLCGSRFQHLLHREAGTLALPANERRTVVFKQKCPAGHSGTDRAQSRRYARSQRGTTSQSPTFRGSSVLNQKFAMLRVGVIASEAKQSRSGLLRHYAPRNDTFSMVNFWFGTLAVDRPAVEVGSRRTAPDAIRTCDLTRGGEERPLWVVFRLSACGWRWSKLNIVSRGTA